MQEKIYTARATTTGGRSGHITSENGELDIDVRMPGTPGNYLNPEILFAGGYSACFDNAVMGVLSKSKIRGINHRTSVEVNLGKLTETSYGFQIEINVQIEGMDQQQAEQIVKSAHAMCPYSNAIKGNVETTLKVNDVQLS